MSFITLYDSTLTLQEIYSLKRDQGMCVAEKVCVHDTGSEPIMNCAIVPDGKNYILAAGQGDSCQIYKLSYKVVVPKVEGQGRLN